MLKKADHQGRSEWVRKFRLGPSLAAALMIGLFEHLVGDPSRCS